ncbi:hypothetical protein MMMDOFMJ_4272 [Methylobacterium gnaphalii]|nr:hypothetical protein MMMDOFMJ_4272 [Methylobacterium gnaphalii]
MSLALFVSTRVRGQLLESRDVVNRPGPLLQDYDHFIGAVHDLHSWTAWFELTPSIG